MQKHQQIPQISPFSYSDATEILWRWGRFRLIKKTRHHSGRSLTTSTSGFFSSLFYCSSFLPSYADLKNSGLGRNLRDSVFSLCQFPRPEGFSFLFYRGEDLGLVEGIQGWVQIPTGSLCQLCLCSVLSISPALCIISLDYGKLLFLYPTALAAVNASFSALGFSRLLRTHSFLFWISGLPWHLQPLWYAVTRGQPDHIELTRVRPAQPDPS